MRQTLFHIPHEILGLPLFGIGWALAVWAVVFAVLALQSWRRNEFSREVAGFSMVMAVVAVMPAPPLLASFMTRGGCHDRSAA